MGRLIARMGLLALVVVVVGGIGVEHTTHFFSKTAASIVYDSRKHGVSCERLPPLSDVERIVEEHQEVIEEIRNINPGFIRVEIASPSGCPEKGEIYIEYASHRDRVRIEELIGETFFGVPWRGINI